MSQSLLQEIAHAVSEYSSFSPIQKSIFYSKLHRILGSLNELTEKQLLGLDIHNLLISELSNSTLESIKGQVIKALSIWSEQSPQLFLCIEKTLFSQINELNILCLFEQLFFYNQQVDPAEVVEALHNLFIFSDSEQIRKRIIIFLQKIVEKKMCNVGPDVTMRFFACSVEQPLFGDLCLLTKELCKSDDFAKAFVSNFPPSEFFELIQHADIMSLSSSLNLFSVLIPFIDNDFDWVTPILHVFHSYPYILSNSFILIVKSALVQELHKNMNVIAALLEISENGNIQEKTDAISVLIDFAALDKPFVEWVLESNFIEILVTMLHSELRKKILNFVQLLLGSSFVRDRLINDGYITELSLILNDGDEEEVSLSSIILEQIDL